MTFAKLIAYSLAGGVALVSAASVPAAQAASFTVYNTGLGNTGNPDANWSIVSAPDNSLVGNAIIFSTIPSAGFTAWLANENSTASKWIGPSNGVNGTQGDPGGTYVYRTTFDLTGFNATTARLVFRATSDNPTTGVTLNGSSFNFTTPNRGFDAFSDPFTISSGFVAGVNTLEFTVSNSSTFNSPSGLRVEFLESTAAAVPEPLTLLGAGTALGFGALFKRKLTQGKTESKA
jgi:hypothetical protein